MAMQILDKLIYQAHAHATGGREGHVSTVDGQLSMKLARPKEMGGSGDGYNPEQLFAAGYSACFLGALNFVALQQNITISNESSVEAIVGFGPIPGGFGLQVELRVYIPELDKDTSVKLVDAAHHVCPYSNVTRDNIQVVLTVKDHP